LYFDTTSSAMKVYNGTSWLDAYASLSGALIATNNLSDLNNTTTARTNLGVAIGTNVQAWDADLDTWATKTAPSGTVVGTSDSQTLTNKTLTTPVISSITNTGTLTLPTSTDTLVGRATTDTLTNKTIALGSNTVSGTLAQFNTAVTDADFVSLAGTETLTNKTLTSPTLTTPALGTPASGVVTNLTGTASININGTVGATTPSTGNFTTLGATGVATFSAGTVSAPAITTTGDTNTGIFFPAADTIAFTEGGAESMRIDSSGNVGIGTSSPSTYSAKLVVTNTTTSTNLSLVNTSGVSNTNTVSTDYYLPDNSTGLSKVAIIGVDNTSATGNRYGNIYFSTSNAGAPAERMRITSGGRVELSSLGVFRLQTGSTTMDCTPTAGATDSFVWNLSNASIFAWSQSGTERMRIDSSGNLLVNTTSQIGNGKISVLAANGATAIGVRIVTNGNYGMQFQNASDTNVGFIQINSSSTQYSTSSDYRLKESIAPMTGALATVQALKPVTYNWKVDGSSSQGFIAHELQAVVPECVTGEKDAVDSDGKPVYQGIDTSFLVATLTAAIQEQQAMIETLTTRLNALEGK
jgi:hypothetical protein